MPATNPLDLIHNVKAILQDAIKAEESGSIVVLAEDLRPALEDLETLREVVETDALVAASASPCDDDDDFDLDDILSQEG